MTWSRHPRRRVPTNLWVIAFAFGLNSDRLLPPFSALELKRRIIRDHYREVIDEMYAVATAAHQSELAAKKEFSSGTTA